MDKDVLNKDKWTPISADVLQDTNLENQKDKNIEVAEFRKQAINKALNDLHIDIQVKDYFVGASVTYFNIEFNDKDWYASLVKAIPTLQMCLGGVPVRIASATNGIFSPGIEVQNQYRSLVGFKKLYTSLPDVKDHPLFIPLGENVKEEPVYLDLESAPHIFLSGTAGSGKSVFINTTITSLIMRNSPNAVKLVLFDPKHVELSRYNDMPHLLCPIVKEANTAIEVLNGLLNEMVSRYEKMAELGCANIEEYNEDAIKNGLNQLPYIVLIFDEYADLFDANKKIQDLVIELAQKSRAAGFHLIVATQVPVLKLLTGTFKANLPTRIAFMMASRVDSMTVLGESDAEKLNGCGDMLIQSSSLSKVGLTRLQAPYISPKESKKVVELLKAKYKTTYDFKYQDNKQERKEINVEPFSDENEEKRYQEIKKWAKEKEFLSISTIQRECSVGFNRANRFFLRLQAEGIVDTSSTSKGCKVIK